MSQLSPERLRANLERHRFEPVYLFLGPDEYRRGEAVDLIKSRALEPGASAFNFDEVSAGNRSVADALAAARTLPMMAERRLLVIDGLEAADDEGKESVREYTSRPEPRTIVVLVAAELDRRTTLYRQLSQSACVVEFPFLKGPALERWAGDYVRRRGIKVSPNTVRQIVDLVGGDLRMLTAEIDKVILSLGQRDVLSDEAVAEMIRSSREQSIFDLTEAIGAKNTVAALRILSRILETDDLAIYVLTMLARHFRQLVIAQEGLAGGMRPAEAARRAGVHPAFAEAFGRQARNVEKQAAVRIFRRLAALDYRMKSSSVEKRMLLEHIICSL